MGGEANPGGRADLPSRVGRRKPGPPGERPPANPGSRRSMLLLLLACTGLDPKDSATPDSQVVDTAGTGDSDTSCTTHPDVDGDGYGDPAAISCEDGAVADATDCDDADASVHPLADEHCDGEDEDCDGAIDEDPVDAAWSTDADGDGHGDGVLTGAGCSVPAGSSALGDDCDDADAAVYPGAPELCDGRDNRCAAWSAPDEYGTVTFFPPSGPARDETSEWTGGHSRVPLELTLEEGTYHLCPATWFVNLVAPAPVTLVGVYGQEVTTLYGVSDRILLAEDDLDVSGLSFTIGNADEGDGGAILHLAGNLTITDSAFLENTGIRGGALAIEHNEYDPGEVTLTDVSFTSGYAEQGGGLYADLNSWLRGERVAFDSNVATDDGGGASVVAAANLVLTDCTFSSNTAADLGGGLYADVSWPIALTDTRFDGNEARGEGAGAWLAGPDNVDLDGLTFESNIAGNGGGGLAAYVDSLRTTALTFTDNVSEGDGGGLYVYASGVSLEDFEASGNRASGAGGGAAVIVTSAFVLSASHFGENEATDAGGFWVFGEGDPSVTADLDDVLLEANVANDGAGARIEVGTTELVAVQVTGNVAGGDGGGLWVDGTVNAAADVTVDANSADRGGGIFLYRGSYTCTGSSSSAAGFRTNSADRGGAVAVGTEYGTQLQAELCDFGADSEDNAATDAGPDVFLTGPESAYDYGNDATFACDPVSCG